MLLQSSAKTLIFLDFCSLVEISYIDLFIVEASIYICNSSLNLYLSSLHVFKNLWRVCYGRSIFTKRYVELK